MDNTDSVKIDSDHQEEKIVSQFNDEKEKTRFKTYRKEIIMSQFNRIFDGNNYFECDKCGSLATIDENGKLMRMITNEQGLPVIYEEENKDLFIDKNGNLQCDCID